MIEPEAAYDLVGQRRFAGTAGAGDAEYRRGFVRGQISQPLTNRLRRAIFQPGDDARQGQPIVAKAVHVDRRRRRRFATLHHIVDHALQTLALAVCRRIDSRNAVSL